MASVSIAAPREQRLWSVATLYMLLAGGVFYLTYGFANWAASQRAFVPTLVFEWERAIPFLAWTIVPYWSLNLFYAASFFMCRTREDLDRHLLRLLLAQAISVAAFLLYPLRFSFERPEVTGLFGVLFAALGSFDQPFNQAPSLHVSLAVIVVARWPRAVYPWFALIIVSALTTYQHHFIDLPAGLWVGLLCLLLVPERRDALRQPGRWDVGAVYAAGAVALLAIDPLWLWWPAGSCAIVAAAYFTGRPALLNKHSWAARVLLAPYFAAVWINIWLWMRKLERAREIAPGVWAGSASCDRSRFRSIVDVAAEVVFDSGEARYVNVPCLDLAPLSREQVARAVAAIDNCAPHRPTLVCCALGVQRSVRVAEAWKTGVLPGPRPHLVSRALVWFAKTLVGAEARWAGCRPSPAPRVYVANHTSHADFVVLWSALPPELRTVTHPVAAADYWTANPVRRYLAQHVFRSVLVTRQYFQRGNNPVDAMSQALAEGKSLIVFPEGTRGRGGDMAEFKCGVWHLACHNPEAEIVPVWLSNLDKVLPRGAIVPRPVRATVTFGAPTQLRAGEDKHEFLGRLRQSVINTREL